MFNNLALTIQSTQSCLIHPKVKVYCETGDCDTGMFHPQFYVPFTGVEWGGLHLKFSPFIAYFN